MIDDTLVRSLTNTIMLAVLLLISTNKHEIL